MSEQLSFVQACAPNVLRGAHTVYVIGSAGCVKIGRSKTWEKRLRELQIGSGEILQVRGLLYDVAANTEAQIHAALSHKRLHGEWFCDDGETWMVLRRFGVESVTPRKSETLTPRDIWTTWCRGLSPGTAVARRSDLAVFGTHAWDERGEIAVIRRVLAVLERSIGALRELAVAWMDHERERGCSIHTRTRRWGTLASLVRTIGEQLPRERGSVAIDLGPMPRDAAVVLDAAAVGELVARASAEGSHRDAAMMGLLGELGESDQHIARLRVHAVRSACVGPLTRAAIERAITALKPGDFAFAGRERGRPISDRGVRMICERYGTTSAALRRAARDRR